MKPNLDNKFGYKVCENNKLDKSYIRLLFITRKYSTAKQVKEYHLKYTRKNLPKKLIKRTTYSIIPITKYENKNGIWKQCPFDID
jgi:hypothetical protein